jgi:hypothetical protein
MSISSCYGTTESKPKSEHFHKDIVSLQDAIDYWSELGENFGVSVHRAVVWIAHKTAIVFSFLFFGIVLGLFGNFLRCIFVGKKKE